MKGMDFKMYHALILSSMPSSQFTIFCQSRAIVLRYNIEKQELGIVQLLLLSLKANNIN